MNGAMSPCECRVSQPLITFGGPAGSAPPGTTVWDTATYKLLFRLEGHASPFPLLLAFSRDDKRMATADQSGS
jgi:hypothetical protein